jgi:WD40 repeat protein
MGILGAVGERVFKEVRLNGTDSKRELTQNNCSQIAFPSTGRLLFCGTDDRDHNSGSVKCYKFPNTQHMEEFQAHDSQGVEKLCITPDDRYLISAGRDGCLMVFEIRDKEARSDKIRETLPIAN